MPDAEGGTRVDIAYPIASSSTSPLAIISVARNLEGGCSCELFVSCIDAAGYEPLY